MMRSFFAVLAFVAALGAGGFARAETVADVRAQLTTLNGQIQELRDELVRQGAAGGLPRDPATVLTRLDQLEAELRRLTDRVEVLVNDIDRIVKDATNRAGELDFRLTELEGGDVSLIGTPEPLGGGVTELRPRARPVATAPGMAPLDAPLTTNEGSAFEAAVAAAEAGDNVKAADLFTTFLATYPGGPLSAEAQFRRGESLSALGDWQSAARSYLDAFSGAPGGPYAPPALYHLGVSLGELGQVTQACQTLAEVDARYPGSAVAGDVAERKRMLNCQ
jgi:tol-pal system protein YbgF